MTTTKVFKLTLSTVTTLTMNLKVGTKESDKKTSIITSRYEMVFGLIVLVHYREKLTPNNCEIEN